MCSGRQPELPLAQASDTICPECGLKDDGSPMIGECWLVRGNTDCEL